ncbi:hypothetical protein E4T39_04286 [Aureobasidium subglaciale]|nr:hypothetical protein E4T39_04286 [Aureobasidium subglaciale]
MDSPMLSSPALGPRPKRSLRMEHAIIDANKLAHQSKYKEAYDLYSRVLDAKSHPVAYLNRALCFLGTGQPHLAVNDAQRAYIMAQSIINVCRGDGEVNDHVRRIDHYVLEYTEVCVDALSRGDTWCRSSSGAFQSGHRTFKLTRMTLSTEEVEEVAGKKKTMTPVVDLKCKALFRLVEALSRCGRGPAYTALQILDDVLEANSSDTTKYALLPFVYNELKALYRTVENKLLDDLMEGRLSTASKQLTLSRFCLLDSAQYGLSERTIDHDLLNNCILTVDANSIAQYDDKIGVPASLVAVQDVFEGMALFTESLPFAVSIVNTMDKSELATMCDTCCADLQMSSPFVLRVLIEELKQAEAEITARRNARMARREARAKSSPAGHRRTIPVDGSSSESPPPASSKATDEVGTERTQPEQIPLSTKHEAGNNDEDSGSDDDWDSEASSGETETCSDNTVPDTPPRGRPTNRPGIFETADIQICRSGNKRKRENFSFCSVDCYELAKATYHDSICGSYLEDYLRQSIITAEDPRLPSVHAQKLHLLLLVRVLGWAYATSTDPLDLPVVQLLMASPRYGPLKDGASVPWSYHNNVLRPFQIFQAMDGRGDAPKSVVNPDYSDGRVINTVIALIQRHMATTDQTLWSKTYDEEGYHEQTFPYAHKPGPEDGNKSVLFGRLHPLCDLVPLAAKPEVANVELVDIGDGRIICLPLFVAKAENEEDDEPCLRKGTKLHLRNAIPRLATLTERTSYGRKEDYGEGDTMMDVDHDENILEEEPEDECSGYVEEESYGADEEMDAFADDDEEMMDF